MQSIIRKIIGGLILVLCVSSCQAQSQKNSIIGKWLFEDFAGEKFVILEFTDSQWKISFVDPERPETESIDNVKIEGKKITIGGEDGWDFEILEQNTLKLMNPGDHSQFFSGKRIEERINSLSGTYILANDVGIFQSIEFVDKKYLKMVGGLLGYNTTISGEYEISGSNLIIKINGGTLMLEIIGSNILKGNTGIGVAVSVFVKK